MAPWDKRECNCHTFLGALFCVFILPSEKSVHNFRHDKNVIKGEGDSIDQRC